LKNYFLDIRNDNYASVATTIFPMLGILGTFISIAISMPDFSVSSTEALDREISILLNGVGTAFYVSIYGIFLSIWWMFLEKRGLSKVDKYTALIRKDFKKYIWDDVTLNHFLYAQNQMHNEDLISSLRENFNVHFMKRFNDSYIESYEKLLENTTKSFREITQNMNNSAADITKSLSSISEAEFKIESKIDIDKRVEKFSEVISKLDDTLDKTFNKLDNEVADIVNRLADFAEVVVRKSDDVERSLSEYHKQVKRLVKD
jgi:predicted transcriptional regulator